jgi:hypothetical protein
MHSVKARAPVVSLISLLCTFPLAGEAVACPGRELAFGARAFRFMEDHSGSVNYYRVVDEGSSTFIRSSYEPPMETAVLGIQVADEDRSRVRTLSWRWRATTLPAGGDECTKGKGDSAAVVYVTWKRGLRWYTLKYVWSSTGVKGSICARKRNPFVAQDTVILRSGGPLNVWQQERIDLRAAFRKHFEDGDPDADVPNFGGVGIMTDGDQTHSRSAADFGSFVVTTEGRCPKK